MSPVAWWENGNKLKDVGKKDRKGVLKGSARGTQGGLDEQERTTWENLLTVRQRFAKDRVSITTTGSSFMNRIPGQKAREGGGGKNLF